MVLRGYGIRQKADRLVDDMTTTPMNDTELDQRIVGQQFLDAERTRSGDIAFIESRGSFL